MSPKFYLRSYQYRAFGVSHSKSFAAYDGPALDYGSRVRPCRFGLFVCFGILIASLALVSLKELGREIVAAQLGKFKSQPQPLDKTCEGSRMFDKPCVAPNEGAAADNNDEAVDAFEVEELPVAHEHDVDDVAGGAPRAGEDFVPPLVEDLFGLNAAEEISLAEWFGKSCAALA